MHRSLLTREYIKKKKDCRWSMVPRPFSFFLPRSYRNWKLRNRHEDVRITSCSIWGSTYLILKTKLSWFPKEPWGPTTTQSQNLVSPYQVPNNVFIQLFSFLINWKYTFQYKKLQILKSSNNSTVQNFTTKLNFFKIWNFFNTHYFRTRDSKPAYWPAQSHTLIIKLQTRGHKDYILLHLELHSLNP